MPGQGHNDAYANTHTNANTDSHADFESAAAAGYFWFREQSTHCGRL